MVAHLEEVAPGVGEGAGVDVNQVEVFKAHLPNLAIRSSYSWTIHAFYENIYKSIFTGGFSPAKMAGFVRWPSALITLKEVFELSVTRDRFSPPQLQTLLCNLSHPADSGYCHLL